MPLQKHVHYLLACSLQGPDTPTASMVAVAAMACPPLPRQLSIGPFFQLWLCLESMDWWQLRATDADNLAAAVDGLTLQENNMHITCKLGDRKCWHCQSGVDPMALKLPRLAQLTIELCGAPRASSPHSCSPGGAAAPEPGGLRAEQETPHQAACGQVTEGKV